MHFNVRSRHHKLNLKSSLGSIASYDLYFLDEIRVKPTCEVEFLGHSIQGSFRATVANLLCKRNMQQILD